MKELITKEENKEKKFNRVKEVVEAMVDRNEFIDSCDSVTKLVNQNFELECARTEVRKIMKELGYKYKKVKHIAMTANSERSMVLRQQWAITLLKQDP